MRLPIGLIATITYRDAPTCYGPPLTRNVLTLRASTAAATSATSPRIIPR